MKRGFMCHSQASTAVCMSTGDYQSVIVPRRPERSSFIDDTRLINYAKYSKLVEPSNLKSTDKKSVSVSVSVPKIRSVSVPKIKLREQDQENKEKAVQKPPTDPVFQVVVMRVALHCQGCAGKVKKHLSKMEGVTSFTIDLESKRVTVTVTGNISPVGVLESISKVKKAEFWPS